MKQRLFKVKPDKLEQWREWAAVLCVREAEVLDTLQQENASRELATLFTVGNEHFVYMAMEFLAEEKSADMNVELNQLHRKNLTECLEPIAKGEPLYDFKANWPSQ